jgi:hypothetical protein
MPNITIEYAIMVPILVLQIFLFPVTASWLMNVWVDSRRTLVLQETASNMGSTIQQIYIAQNLEQAPPGTVIQKSTLPAFIESYPYTGTASLRPVLEADLNSSKILDVTISLDTVGIAVNTSVVLGNNVLWKESTFVSNSTDACIKVEKFVNGTISLSFGG